MNVSALARIPIVLLAGATSTFACVPAGDEPVGDMCVAGYQAGQRLALRLGPIYDANSEYWFDQGMFGSFAPVAVASCAAVDGFDSGVALAFMLSERYAGRDCAVWRGSLDPEPVQAPRFVGTSVPAYPGITIAAALAEGTVTNRDAFAVRALYTPNMMPDSTAVPRQLPPLVVTREIHWLTSDGTYAARCFDAWVASWESTP